MELLRDLMEVRGDGQLKDLISDRSRWRQDSKWECLSETCWKQQKTRERDAAFCCQILGCFFLWYVACLLTTTAKSLYGLS